MLIQSQGAYQPGPLPLTWSGLLIVIVRGTYGEKQPGLIPQLIRLIIAHDSYRTRVDSMKRRANEATGWDLRVTDLVDNKTSVQSFDKVVLCTGTSSLPNIPKSLVDRNQFKGLVVHTSELGSKAQTILDDTQPRSSGKDETIVVIGGGKSAADAAAWFGSQDRRVTLVMNESLWHIPLPSFRAPNFLRRSRCDRSPPDRFSR